MALKEASENPHSFHIRASVDDKGAYGRGTCRLDRAVREFFHSNHRSLFSVGSGSSQFEVLQFKSLRISLPCIATGAANPKGSYKLFMADRTPLLVKGFSSVLAWKVRVSVFRSQSRPRLHCIGRVSVPRS